MGGGLELGIRGGREKREEKKDASDLQKSHGHSKQEVSTDTDLNLFVSQCSVKCIG